MTERPLDPRLEKLVASLYGELSQEEERELQELLGRDEALRAEWEELRSTRTLLGAYEVEERAPSFVLVEAEPRRSVGLRTGFWPGLAEGLKRLVAPAGWAVAAAAVLVMVLAVKGFRIERIENGLALSFGGRQAANAPAETPVARSTGPGYQPFGPGAPEPASAGGDYLTQSQFQEYSTTLVSSVAAVLNDYRTRRDQEMAAIFRTMYGEMNDRQYANYRDLLGRIDAVGLGLSAEQSRTNAMIEDIVNPGQADSLAPARRSPGGMEDKR